MSEAQRPVAASAAPAGAGGRPVGAGGSPPGVSGPASVGAPASGHNAMTGTSSGFEGREELLGKAMALAIRTLKDTVPYQHEMNDALVKVHLMALQFAKNKGLVADLVAHDIKTMQPMLQRVKGIIEKTGDKENALVAMFERTACLYQLCLDLSGSAGRREFTFPFTTVLTIGRRIGQFDLDDSEVHELWIKPRLRGYAEVMGVKIDVSDLGPNGKVVVSLVD